MTGSAQIDPRLQAASDGRGHFRWLADSQPGVIVAFTPVAGYRIFEPLPGSFDFDPARPFFLSVDHLAYVPYLEAGDSHATLEAAKEAALSHFLQTLAALRHMLGAVDELAEATGYEIGTGFPDRTDLPFLTPLDVTEAA